MRLLVVEDESRLAEVIRRGLVENAYAVDVAGTAADALDLAVANDYDLIILDRRLPDGDGAQVTAELRRNGLRTPVLLLTARDAVEDRVEGLDLGADDYLVKPFAFPELTARVRALVRREMPEREPILRAGQIAIDPAAHSATYAGTPIRLAPREFAVLEYLLRRKGDVVTRRRSRSIRGMATSTASRTSSTSTSRGSASSPAVGRVPSRPSAASGIACARTSVGP
jgi:DNA-binding response OmpR family regulator